VQKSDEVPLFEYGREIKISGKISIPKGRTNPGDLITGSISTTPGFPPLFLLSAEIYTRRKT